MAWRGVAWRSGIVAGGVLCQNALRCMLRCMLRDVLWRGAALCGVTRRVVARRVVGRRGVTCSVVLCGGAACCGVLWRVAL